MRRVLVYSLLVAVLIVVSGCAHVQPAYPPTSMVADATSAVVKVSGDNKQCSAVVVETVETDVIVSAAHCSAASKILINDHYVGTIRWTARSAFRDVAMGRYTSSQTIPRVKVASSQPPNDVPVWVVGFTNGKLTVASGIKQHCGFWQCFANMVPGSGVNPGMFGGAVLTSDGLLIGILVAVQDKVSKLDSSYEVTYMPLKSVNGTLIFRT